MKKLILLSLMAASMAASAQEPSDSTVSFKDRLHLSAFGEAVYQYSFGSVAAPVSSLEEIREAPRHSSLAIPRIVLQFGADLGKGWGIETDVQLENCRDVSLDQFWIQKEFIPQLGVAAGYFTLPVGAVNAHDNPLEFFTVSRPEIDDEILPADWHQTALQLYGAAGPWSYQAFIIPGIVTSIFNGSSWLGLRDGLEAEYRSGHDFALAGRIDNESVDGLRLSLSGYWGLSSNNRLSFPLAAERIKGNVGFLAFDAAYDAHGFVARANANWARFSKSVKTMWLGSDLSDMSDMSDMSDPSDRSDSSSRSAFSASAELGYDLFYGRNLGGTSKIARILRDQKLYVFGRYDYWEPAEEGETFLGYDWSRRQRLTLGLNWCPIPQVAVKATYSHTFGPAGTGTLDPDTRLSVPALGIAIAYSANFF